jgi:hypothetical protein
VLLFCCVGFEVFTAVTMKNAVFWDVAPCGFIINRRFEGTCRLHLQDRRNNASEEKCYTVANRLNYSSEALIALIITLEVVGRLLECQPTISGVRSGFKILLTAGRHCSLAAGAPDAIRRLLWRLPEGALWEVSMTCRDRNQHLCSYCWDGAQSQYAEDGGDTLLRNIGL